jgi:regulator of sigma E protease
MTYFADLSTDVFAVLIVLGTLVFIHELGHYLAAKGFGVRVDVFSLGFGKRLFGFKRGDTDYRISALPLGGYVKMAGENPLEQATGDPGEFVAKPRWQRLIIAAAGPVVNIGFAIALVTGIFMLHYEHPAYLDRAPVIANVDPGSVGAALGLQPGDQIVKVDGAATQNWESANARIIIDAGQTAHLTIQRGGHEISKDFAYDKPNTDPIDYLGVEPDQPYVIGRLSPEFPAAQAGLKVGDQIVSVNGTPVHSTGGLSRVLQQTKDKPVEIKVNRDGKLLTFKVAPKLDQETDSRYRIGVAEAIHVDQLPFLPALRSSIHLNEQYSMMIIDVLQRMVGHFSLTQFKQMSGPVGIAQQSGEALKEGWLVFLFVMAMISLNLGIFNLLPIPILDGGLILMILIEGVIRRDIKREIKELVYQAAFVFLVLFAVFVIFNDITKTSMWQHIR